MNRACGHCGRAFIRRVFHRPWGLSSQGRLTGIRPARAFGLSLTPAPSSQRGSYDARAKRSVHRALLREMQLVELRALLALIPTLSLSTGEYMDHMDRSTG